MTRFDVIDAIKAYNDPNSCYRPEPKVVCSITFPDGSKLENQTPDENQTELFNHWGEPTNEE